MYIYIYTYFLLNMGDFPASHVSLQGNEGIPSLIPFHQDAELLALEEELKALDAEAGRKLTKGELPQKGLYRYLGKLVGLKYLCHFWDIYVKLNS